MEQVLAELRRLSQAMEGRPGMRSRASSGEERATTPTTFDDASVQQLSTAVKDALAPLLKTGAAAAAGGGGGGGGGTESAISASADLRSLRSVVTSNHDASVRRADEAATSLAALTRQVSALQNSASELNVAVNRISAMLNAREEPTTATSGVSASGSAEVGWTVWLMIVLSTVLLVVLTVFTFVQHARAKKDRYKFM